MIIQLSKNIRFVEVCLQTMSAGTIPAQMAPLGWLADTVFRKSILKVFDDELS